MGKTQKPVTPNPETPRVSDTVTISTLRTVDTQILPDVSTQHSSMMSTWAERGMGALYIKYTWSIGNCASWCNIPAP